MSHIPSKSTPPQENVHSITTPEGQSEESRKNTKGEWSRGKGRRHRCEANDGTSVFCFESAAECTKQRIARSHWKDIQSHELIR